MHIACKILYSCSLSTRNMSAWHQSTLNIEHCKCKHLITWVFIVAVICQCNATRTNHLRKTEWKFMEAINIGKISAIFFECRLIYSLQAVQRALISSHFFVIAFWFSLFLFSPFVRISTRSHWCIHENAVYIHISFMTYNNKLTYTHKQRRTRSCKRVNNKNWRQNIEWLLFYSKQQGIHTCVWQFWCERTRVAICK